MADSYIRVVVQDVYGFTSEQILQATVPQCAECLDDIREGDDGGRLIIAGGVLHELWCADCWKEIRRRVLDNLHV